MSKILSLCLVLILSTTTVFADDFGFNPGRPGPSRPGDDRPGRPGDDRPGRPGDDRPDRPNRPPVERVVFRVINTVRVQKLLETTTTLRVNIEDMKALKFKALHNAVEIIEARALLANGREIYMDQVTGGLRDGREVVYTFNGSRGERVRTITVRAVTRNLIGSRADLEISAGVQQ